APGNWRLPIPDPRSPQYLEGVRRGTPAASRSRVPPTVALPLTATPAKPGSRESPRRLLRGVAWPRVAGEDDGASASVRAIGAGLRADPRNGRSPQRGYERPLDAPSGRCAGARAAGPGLDARSPQPEWYLRLGHGGHHRARFTVPGPAHKLPVRARP